MTPRDGHLIQEDEHSCQSKNKAAVRDRPCRSEDRSSQEGGDDGNYPATIHPLNNEEEEEALDLRTNPFQEGGDEGRGPSTSPHASPPKGRFGPTTRVMAKRIQEDWNAATDGRETFLYMFKCHKL